jgi:hypothetical protein
MLLPRIRDHLLGASPMPAWAVSFSVCSMCGSLLSLAYTQSLLPLAYTYSLLPTSRSCMFLPSDAFSLGHVNTCIQVEGMTGRRFMMQTDALLAGSFHPLAEEGLRL